MGFRLFCLVMLGFAAGKANARNMLILLADDGGLQGGVFDDSSVPRTPNLDGIGRRGVNFRRAFTSVSSCSPSRAALLTGLPSHQNGLYGLHQGAHHFDAFRAAVSLPGLLRRQRGVVTGIIGKKHVGPADAFRFDFEQTEENNHINQVGRNITHIKELVRRFLHENVQSTDTEFLLYVAFHDPHRCGHTQPQLGQFCQKFGNRDYPGMGDIPDWTPEYYRPEDVSVPSWLPQTAATRQELAEQYTTISRLDQGVGLVLEEVRSFGALGETLVLYTSDNGIPFAAGRTNFYDSGIQEPFLLSSPLHPSSHGQSSDRLVSLLDVVPTALDWFGVDYPADYHILDRRQPTTLTGKSLLPFLDLMNDREDVEQDEDEEEEEDDDDDEEEEEEAVFGSHNLHEVTMYYPMRYVRTPRFKLIHNLNSRASFPIDQDFYLSQGFQYLLQRWREGRPANWTRGDLGSYYRRAEWELFDLDKDPDEVVNLAGNDKYGKVLSDLKSKLADWRRRTFDPWLCAPGGVLEAAGAFADDPRCLPLYNEEEEDEHDWWMR